MTLSRRQLYAAGETFGSSCTRYKPGGRILGGGGDSESQSSNATTNTDQRVAVQDGVGLSGSSGNTINVNSSDAIKAIASMGADTINRAGAAVVELNQASLQANVTAWDKTVTAGAALVDKLIESNTQTTNAVVEKFQPQENRREETLQTAAIAAAAGLAAIYLLK